MSKITVIASFYPKEDKVNDVREILLSMTKPTRLEQGNELYNFYGEKNSENKIESFHLFEIYKNTEALDFHRNTMHYKEYRSKINDLLNKPIEVKVLSPIDII